MKRKNKDADFYKDRESQIEAIERSFTASKKPVNMKIFENWLGLYFETQSFQLLRLLMIKFYSLLNFIQ